MLEYVVDVFVDVIEHDLVVQFSLALAIRTRHILNNDSTCRFEQVAVAMLTVDIHQRTTRYVVKHLQ